MQSQLCDPAREVALSLRPSPAILDLAAPLVAAILSVDGTAVEVMVNELIAAVGRGEARSPTLGWSETLIALGALCRATVANSPNPDLALLLLDTALRDQPGTVAPPGAVTH